MLSSAFIASLFMGGPSCILGSDAHYITVDDFILHLSRPGIDIRSSFDDLYIPQRSCESDVFDICIIGDYPFFFTASAGQYSEIIEGVNYDINIYLRDAHAPGSSLSVVQVTHGGSSLIYEYDRNLGVTQFVEHVKHHDGFEVIQVFLLQDGNYLGCQAEN